eukprot:15470348-Alexandrium_andersonii.AAC.1
MPRQDSIPPPPCFREVAEVVAHIQAQPRAWARYVRAAAARVWDSQTPGLEAETGSLEQQGREAQGEWQ